jgi:hypothetical protein
VESDGLNKAINNSGLILIKNKDIEAPKIQNIISANIESISKIKPLTQIFFSKIQVYLYDQLTSHNPQSVTAALKLMTEYPEIIQLTNLKEIIRIVKNQELQRVVKDLLVLYMGK